MPSTVLSVLQIFAWLILIRVLLLCNAIMKWCYYCPCFTDEESETGRCEGIGQPTDTTLRLRPQPIPCQVGDVALFPHPLPHNLGQVTWQCWGQGKRVKLPQQGGQGVYTRTKTQRAKPEGREISRAAPPTPIPVWSSIPSYNSIHSLSPVPFPFP